MKNEQLPSHDGAGYPKPQLQHPKVYCKKDLTRLYKVSYRILSTWLKPMAAEIGPMHGRYYTVAQVKIIFDTLGHPNE